MQIVMTIYERVRAEAVRYNRFSTVVVRTCCSFGRWRWWRRKGWWWWIISWWWWMKYRRKWRRRWVRGDLTNTTKTDCQVLPIAACGHSLPAEPYSIKTSKAHSHINAAPSPSPAHATSAVSGQQSAVSSQWSVVSGQWPERTRHSRLRSRYVVAVTDGVACLLVLLVESAASVVSEW